MAYMKRQKQNSKGLENNFLVPTLASAEAVFSNEDLLHEILLRVPARSLVRFKCVSKFWLGLISDQKFCYNHTTQNCKSISALYFQMGSYAYDNLNSVSHLGHLNYPSLSFLDSIKKTGNIMVIHILNGLTLCSYGGWPKKFIVCNITTQKYRIISQPTERAGCCSLAYDPAVSPYYKIVLFGNIYVSNHDVYIYSSEKSSWTQFHDPEVADIYAVSTAFFNGSVHCVKSGYHFRFKVDTEKLTKTPLPSEPQIHDRDKINFFGECGGNLLLVQDADEFFVGYSILQMEMKTNRWILKKLLSLGSIAKAFPDERYRFNLLTILERSHKVGIILVFLIKGKVIAYYSKCKQFKTIGDIPDKFSRLKYVQRDGVYQHFESLCPV